MAGTTQQTRNTVNASGNLSARWLALSRGRGKKEFPDRGKAGRRYSGKRIRSSLGLSQARLVELGGHFVTDVDLSTARIMVSCSIASLTPNVYRAGSLNQGDRFTTALRTESKSIPALLERISTKSS